MIGRLLGLLVRVLLETAVLLVVTGLLLAVLSYRVGRRLVVDRPDRLERLAGAPWIVPVCVRLFEAVGHARGGERLDSDGNPDDLEEL